MNEVPFFAVREPEGDPKAIALVLHGGQETSTSPVRARQLAVVRMAPFTASLRRAGARPGLAVARMRYLLRGWNGGAQAPVGDVRWVLDRLAERYPGVPVGLVGHSMGGRAALYAADHPAVSTVVALAPWIEAGDPYRTVAGRDVLVLHGDADRITGARASAAWTRQAAAVAASTTYVSLRREGHAMLRRAALWHGVTTGYVLATMCATPPTESTSGRSADVVSRVLSGEASLVV